MAQLRIEWTKTAQVQRNEIMKYWKLRTGNTKYSLKIKFRIISRTNILKIFPFFGKPTDFKEIREVPMKDYSIFYDVFPDKVLIMAFWDNRQDPQKLYELLNQ
jgi:ParE toxin of type II toxin-antitoxin system, parDE